VVYDAINNGLKGKTFTAEISKNTGNDKYQFFSSDYGINTFKSSFEI